MKRLMRKDQFGALRIGQSVGDEIDVEILVATVNFVADDGVAEVGQVDSYLMLATRMRLDFEITEWVAIAFEVVQHAETGVGGQAVRTHTILDGDMTVQIAPEWFRNFADLMLHISMNDGVIGFSDSAALPGTS